MKKKHYMLLAAAALLLMGATWAWTIYRQFAATLLAGAETHYLYIDNDDTADSVFAKLKPVSTETGMKGLQRLASHYDYDANIRTGRYAIEPGKKTLDVFRQLRNAQQSPVMLTVPEVRTMDRMAARLGAKLMLDSTVLAQSLTNQQFCQQWGYDTATIACLFVPNTYEVYWNVSLDALMKRMQKEHDNYWNNDRRKKAEVQGLTPNEVATLASIIDEETANNAEKPMIAGMYLNRLHRGMLLQADPTVKFALGDFTLRRILNKHLEVESPYNTYKWAALPPTPISNPGLVALKAVADPPETDYFYFVLTDPSRGSHTFSKDFKGHIQAENLYTKPSRK